MSKIAKLMQTAAAGVGGAEPAFIEDVFATYTFVGTSALQTINNGIDLSGEGGLVWHKYRDAANSPAHRLYDTARGAGNYLRTTDTTAQQGSGGIGFTSTGFTADGFDSESNKRAVTWTFRKARRFFDIVTYTGGGSSQTISHNLGVAPGMIIVKSYSATNPWVIYHRSEPNKYGILNTTAAFTDASASNVWGNGSVVVAPTSSNFTVGGGAGVNASGQTYVAYLFAHDPLGPSEDGSDGLVACGSVENGATVDLGWEPQWVLFKSLTSTEEWYIQDIARGMSGAPIGAYVGSNVLIPNSTAEEEGRNSIHPLSKGFTFTAPTPGQTYMYVAIRRGEMKVPTLASNTLYITSYGGNSVEPVETFHTIGSGVWRPDLIMITTHGEYGGGASGSNQTNFFPRWLSYNKRVPTVQINNTATELVNYTGSYTYFVDQNRNYHNGFYINRYESGSSSYKHDSTTTHGFKAFKRARGFMDCLHYVGTGSAGLTVKHDLGVKPQFIAVKQLETGSSSHWVVYADFEGMGATKFMYWSKSDAAATSSAPWNDTEPTESVFTVGGNSIVNNNGSGYLAWLLATAPGVSKVGTYTGNGTTNGNSQDIDCGFTTGTQMVIFKNIDNTSNWIMIDKSMRNSPPKVGADAFLRVNTTDTAIAAFNNYDMVDSLSTGFRVKYQSDPGVNDIINKNGDRYIFIAFAN